MWLRGNVDTHLRISDKGKNIFVYQEKDQDDFIINLVIINAKVVLYKRRPDRGELRVSKVLRFTYNEMLNDEYDCGVHRKTDLFEHGWRKCRASLRSKFI